MYRYQYNIIWNIRNVFSHVAHCVALKQKTNLFNLIVFNAKYGKTSTFFGVWKVIIMQQRELSIMQENEINFSYYVAN